MYRELVLPRLTRFTGPVAMLVLLLQRTPLWRVVTSADFSAAPRLGQLLRAAFPALAGITAVNTLTGATQFSINPASPASGTQGASFSAVFAVTGTPSVPKCYTVTGLPAGLSVPSGTLSGTKWTLNASSGSITGIPTVSGTFTVAIQAWEKVGATGEKSPVYNYVINLAGGATAPPAFTTQPTSQTVTVGANVTFTVAASGTPAPALQWRKGGANLAGQTSATLTLNGVTSTSAGSYDCVATNSAGSATSSPATLTVNAATSGPSFTTQPGSQSVAAGTTVTLTVAASGTPTPMYQWRKNGANLAGRTSATLTLTSVVAADAGNYDCVATNSAGSATSTVAVISVAAAAPPSITTQPAPMTSLAGSGAFFFVQATGSGLTYQWRKNGNVIAGATQSTLMLSNVQAADAGAYSVVVADGASAQVASNEASLAIANSGSARLVNMSARAGVGTGSGALIPGLVIQGDVALTLLIRGVGPHLANFGVTGVLSDPVMTVFQGNTAIVSNDDWEQNTNLAALNAATSAEGAFPLAAGGKDSATLITLNPGIYTVQVTGKNGAVGEGLVEVYVVGQ